MKDFNLGFYTVAAPDGKEYNLSIEHDYCPEDPRNDVCNKTHMHIFDTEYNLGDYTYTDDPFEFMKTIVKFYAPEVDTTDIKEVRELKAILMKLDNIVYKPVYIYDHSGIVLSTTPFNDRWDSWECGFIYIDHDAVGEESDWKATAAGIIEQELKTYNEFIAGEVFEINFSKFVTEEVRCPHCNEVIETKQVELWAEELEHYHEHVCGWDALEEILDPYTIIEKHY